MGEGGAARGGARAKSEKAVPRAGRTIRARPRANARAPEPRADGADGAPGTDEARASARDEELRRGRGTVASRETNGKGRRASRASTTRAADESVERRRTRDDEGRAATTGGHPAVSKGSPSEVHRGRLRPFWGADESADIVNGGGLQTPFRPRDSSRFGTTANLLPTNTGTVVYRSGPPEGVRPSPRRPHFLTHTPHDVDRRREHSGHHRVRARRGRHSHRCVPLRGSSSRGRARRGKSEASVDPPPSGSARRRRGPRVRDRARRDPRELAPATRAVETAPFASRAEARRAPPRGLARPRRLDPRLRGARSPIPSRRGAPALSWTRSGGWMDRASPRPRPRAPHPLAPRLHAPRRDRRRSLGAREPSPLFSIARSRRRP